MVKKYCLMLGIFLGLSSYNLVLAQDPGNRDTVRVSTATATAFGQHVVIEVTAYNDEPVSGLAIPLKFSGQCLFPDSISLVGSRFSNALLKLAIIDTAGQTFILGAIYTSGFLPPGEGLMGKLYFTVKSGVTPETVSIDTFSNESISLLFVDTTTVPAPKEIIPVFKPGAVYCNVPPKPVPHAPVIQVPGPQTVFGGQTLNFSVTATDVDTQDVLTITKSGVGSFVFSPKKSPATGFFTWKPSNADTLGSPYSVTFTVNDGTGLEDTGTVEITVEPFFVPPSGLEGDLNGDHKVDIADIVYFVNFLFKDGPPPNPLAAGDINGDCFVTLSDLIYLVNFIYNNGPFPTFRCLPGDFNYDGYVNLMDIIYAVNYILRSGEPPRSQKSADINADCKINIVDIVYLVDFIFRSGPAPKVGCGVALASVTSVTATEIAEVGWGATQSFKNKFLEIPLQANFNSKIAGVMFTVEFDPEVLRAFEPQLTERTDNLQLFYSIKENQMTIGILDLTGQNYISPGEGALVNLRFENKTTRPADLSSIRITNSEFVNPQAQDLQVRIVKSTISNR